MAKKELRKPLIFIGLRSIVWCGKWDLNPYVFDTRPSNVPVCLFQHCRILFCFLSFLFLVPYDYSIIAFYFPVVKRFFEKYYCLQVINLMFIFTVFCA